MRDAVRLGLFNAQKGLTPVIGVGIGTLSKPLYIFLGLLPSIVSSMDIPTNSPFRRTIVFGMFAFLPYFTTFVTSSNKRRSIANRFCRFVVCALPFITIIPLLFNLVLLFSTNHSAVFSKEWAMTLCFTMLFLHGIVSAFILHRWNNADLLDNFSNGYAHFARANNTKANACVAGRLGSMITTVVSFAAIITFCIRTYVDYDIYYGIQYRQSPMPDLQPWLFYSATLLWAVWLSVIAVCCSKLMVNGMFVVVGRFNERLRLAAESGQLTAPEVLSGFNEHHVELLKFVRDTNAHFGVLTTLSTVVGYTGFLLTIFVLRSFGGQMHVAETAETVLIQLHFLSMFSQTLRMSGELYVEIAETKNILLYNKSVAAGKSEATTAHAKMIVRRIKDADYAVLIMDGFVAKLSTAGKLMTLVPFFLELAEFAKSLNR